MWLLLLVVVDWSWFGGRGACGMLTNFTEVFHCASCPRRSHTAPPTRADLPPTRILLLVRTCMWMRACASLCVWYSMELRA
jgi:hypothetical protein